QPLPILTEKDVDVLGKSLVGGGDLLEMTEFVDIRCRLIRVLPDEHLPVPVLHIQESCVIGILKFQQHKGTVQSSVQANRKRYELNMNVAMVGSQLLEVLQLSDHQCRLTRLRTDPPPQGCLVNDEECLRTIRLCQKLLALKPRSDTFLQNIFDVMA